jgi:hypothetical protein
MPIKNRVVLLLCYVEPIHVVRVKTELAFRVKAAVPYWIGFYCSIEEAERRRIVKLRRKLSFI